VEGQTFVGTEDALTQRIIAVFYQVYNELGSGFIESVYARAMAIALKQAGLEVAPEVFIPVSFRGELIGTFRADLIVEGKVVLEFKIADQIIKAYEAQLTHYLRASTFELGMILSFGETPKVRRIEFLNERKRRFQGSALIPPLSVVS
jgi:GxxExxY protein